MIFLTIRGNNGEVVYQEQLGHQRSWDHGKKFAMPGTCSSETAKRQSKYRVLDLLKELNLDMEKHIKSIVCEQDSVSETHICTVRLKVNNIPKPKTRGKV
jgi:hypothetical protein